MRWTSVEQLIDERAHATLRRLPANGPVGAAVEFVVFGLKQGWACLFGALLLALIIVTDAIWPTGFPLPRYDFLTLAALAIQIAMLRLKLETRSEAVVILIFHIVGTGMEIFKTAAGSWIYPEPSLLRIAGVPLFSGFMYAAVGSYLARVTRTFDFRFTHYPPIWATVALATSIYINFFTHHFTADIRLGLFAFAALLYFRTAVHYRVFRYRLRMPLLLGFGLVALFIWFAENIATFGSAWVYPGQAAGWHPVGIEKLGAWYLLMLISFVLVTLVHRPRALGDAVDSAPAHTNVRRAVSP